jgi:hypothetical protein
MSINWLTACFIAFKKYFCSKQFKPLKMKNTAILQLSAKYQLTQTVVILAATMLLPVLVHLIPTINGNISGAVLLPIFLAPLVAAFVYKRHVAIFAGIFAPLLNYLIMGRPAPEMVIMLGFEIVLFVVLLSWLKDLKGIRYFAAPLAFLVVSFVVAIGLSLFGSLANPVSFWANSTSIAIPGILLMWVINLAILRFRK